MPRFITLDKEDDGETVTFTGVMVNDPVRYDSGGFEVLSPVDEINEHLGYDADVSDARQYCRTCGQFIGSPGGPDYICWCG